MDFHPNFNFNIYSRDQVPRVWGNPIGHKREPAALFGFLQMEYQNASHKFVTLRIQKVDFQSPYRFPSGLNCNLQISESVKSQMSLVKTPEGCFALNKKENLQRTQLKAIKKRVKMKN